MSQAPEPRHLRLTLRTLLAWLDDTLPPDEVRQMGHQVAESPVAKELVDRIQHVTRRRRLTVPPSTGSDAVDPNIVSAYLDNELGAEQVAEYEKRCLNSEVHLAEAASCHQILSMIGQKAKVPPEARHRMYRLVRGRESVGRDVPRAFIPPREPAPFEMPRWGNEESARPSPWSRWLLPTAALLMVVLMGVSAWRLMPARPPLGVGETVSAPGAGALPPLAPVRPEGGERTAVPPLAKADPVVEPAAEVAAPPPGELKAAPVATAILTSEDTVALRWNATTRAWERLTAGAELKAGDRVVGLAPFLSTMTMGSLRATLVGPAEIRVHGAEADGTPQIEPIWGRVQLDAPEGPEALAVETEGARLRLTGLTGHRAGLEPFGSFGDQPGSGLLLYAVNGALQLHAGKGTETLTGPGSIEFRPPDGLSGARSGAVPAWLSADSPSEVERVAGEAFRAYFKPSTATTRALVEALEDDQESVRVLATEALGALGQLDEVVFALDRRDDPATRRAAAEVLRAYDDRGVAAEQAVAAALERFSGADWAATVRKQLDGYSADEATDPETFKTLVKLLEHREVAIRQLALDQLTTLTGRDSLEYNPDQPQGAGLKAWQDLARAGNLHRRR